MHLKLSRRYMAKLLTTLVFLVSFVSANASITGSYCEKQTEAYAEKYFKTVRFGPLQAKPRTVSIRAVVASTVVDGERYKIAGQAHVTYTGSTGGEVNEVRYFETVIEDDEPRPNMVYFKEVKEKK